MTTTMKFSVFTIAALATATSSRCIVAATAAARKRNVTNGLIWSIRTTQPRMFLVMGRGDRALYRLCPNEEWHPNHWRSMRTQPYHGWLLCDPTGIGARGLSPHPNVISIAFSQPSVCQNGQSGSSCGVITDCVVPPGLDHAVCRHNQCQR